MYLRAATELARNDLSPAYKPIDEHSAHDEGGRVDTHPAMQALWPKLVELGALNASRPFDVDGQQLPLSVQRLGQVATTPGPEVTLSGPG